VVDIAIDDLYCHTDIFRAEVDHIDTLKWKSEERVER